MIPECQKRKTSPNSYFDIIYKTLYFLASTYVKVHINTTVIKIKEIEGPSINGTIVRLVEYFILEYAVCHKFKHIRQLLNIF
jgi:hypothetical protein